MYLEFIPANTAPTVVDAVIGGVNASIPGSVQHQFTANDTETPAGPFTWDQLTFLGYTPNYGGAGPGPANNPTLSGSGLFDWNTVGSPRGDYKWQVRGTDPGGLSDTGTIDIAVVEVPEPTTRGAVRAGDRPGRLDSAQGWVSDKRIEIDNSRAGKAGALSMRLSRWR